MCMCWLMIVCLCVYCTGYTRGSGGGGGNAGGEIARLHAERGPGGTGTCLLHPTTHEVHRQTARYTYISVLTNGILIHSRVAKMIVLHFKHTA